jgi:hypothetical protein
MVKCNKCGKVKHLSEYRKPSINKCGTKGVCKLCKQDQDKIYWKEKYQDINFKQKHFNNQEKYKEKKTIYQKKYDADNVNRKREYTRNKYKNDPSTKSIQLVRTRIWHVLKSQYKNKEKSTLEMLGCSSKEYKLYLEQQFDDKMNWNNHGTYWEIDHIIPLNQGGSFHYTNTRPLEKNSNRTRKKK